MCNFVELDSTQQHCMKTQKPSIKRAPTGVVTARPIALRLLPSDMEQVEQVATAEKRSLASVARLAMLRGLAEYQRDPRALTQFV